MAIDLKNILNYVAPAPTYLGKLEEVGQITSDDLDQLRNQSLVRGLLTAGLGYLAQPKNQRYGSPLPYLGKAGLMGLQAMDQPYQDYMKGFEFSTKLEKAQKSKEDEKRRLEIVQRLKDSGLYDETQMAAIELASKDALLEMIKPKAAKAPTRSKIEVGVDTDGDGQPDRLDVVTQEFNSQTGKFEEINRAPKEINLDTLFEDETIDLLAAQFEQTGTLPTLGRGKTGEQNRKAVYDRVAERARNSGFVNQDGSVNIEEYVADVQAQKQELRSSNLNLNRFDTGPQGNRVESLNVGIDHIVSFRKIVDSLKNNDFKDVNRLRNYFSRRYSNPELASFETAKPIISTEVAKGIIGGNVMTREDRAELQNTIDAAQSWEEINAALDTALVMLAGQMEGLKNQYESGLTKRVLDRNPFDERLNDKTKKVLKDIREKYNPEKKSSSVTTKQISAEDQAAIDYFNSLPDGNVTKEQYRKVLKAKGLIQ